VIPENVSVFLINAIYFKGNWADKFDPQQTKQTHFHNGDQTKKTIFMMNQHREDWSYFETPSFQVIDLPYGNSQFVATILLPSSDLNQFISKFPENELNEIFWDRPIREGSLCLPRFKVEFSVDLAEPFQSLGVTKIFSGPLARMSSDPSSRVGKIIHKVVIIVNEEGTEAAAVTALSADECEGEDPPFRMVCDRPFLFFLRERTTGCVLFMGKIDDPQ